MLKIKEIRRKKNLTQDDIAQLSGIKKRTYVNYEKGNTDISLSKLQKIATVLEVSISSLIDEESKISETREATDEKVSMYEKQVTPNIIAVRINKMFENYNTTSYKISQITPFTQSIINRWMRGETKPTSSNLKILLNAFPNINPNWLFTGNDKMLKNREVTAKDKDLTFLNISRLVERIKELAKEKNISANKIARNIGMSEPGVRNVLKNRIRKPQQRTLYAILNYLINANDNIFRNYNLTMDEKVSMFEKYAIPLVRIKAVSGFGNSDFAIADKDIKEKYVIPMFKHLNVDFMIEIQGSSMYPKYASGDVIACRIIRDRSFIQWNKIHLVATRNQWLIVKRIQESKNKDSLTMVSDNKKYKPFDVPKDEITGLALVVGVVRME